MVIQHGILGHSLTCVRRVLEICGTGSKIPMCISSHLARCIHEIQLRWRHNEHGGISKHQPHDRELNCLFRGRSKKISNSASLALVEGIYRWPVNSLHKGPVTREMSPFDDVIMKDGLGVHLLSWRVTSVNDKIMALIRKIVGYWDMSSGLTGLRKCKQPIAMDNIYSPQTSQVDEKRNCWRQRSCYSCLRL